MIKTTLIVLMPGIAAVSTSNSTHKSVREQIQINSSDSYNWGKHIRSGKQFKATLNGSIGTLSQGKVYLVTYGDEGFETTGYNLGYESVISATYDNANPKKNEISLWGAVFTFDKAGKLFYKGEEMGKIFL